MSTPQDDFSALFAPDLASEPTPGPGASGGTWKVLLVDDEPDIHAVLRLALQDLVVEGLPLQLFDARSAEEAKALLAAHPDMALILLDVVMETEQAGLTLVRYVRRELGNRSMQIVLVTGQPGYAPLREVVMDYRIDGYRLKSELTADKIFVSVYVALRTFRALRDLAAKQEQLEAAEDRLQKERMLKQAEAALRESEEKFRTIVDAINDAILIHDASSGHILDVNHRACQMYGYSREQLIGLDVSDLSVDAAPFTPEDVAEKLRLARQLQQPAFEWLARDSGGRQFWASVNLEVLTIAGEQRVMAVVRDIDTRKRAEQDLKTALADAQALNRKLVDAQNQLLQSEKMASLGQLAAGVAHELNNPISFVHSNLGTLETYIKDIFEISEACEQVAQRSGDLTDYAGFEALKQDKDFDFIRQDIVQLMAESKDGLGRVRKIVQDLKSFSRVGETDWQWADLHQGLDSTLNIVWNELKYKCTVRKEYGALPQIHCVISQINQVFMNLLVNASHAIPETGEIRIRTGRQGDEVFVAISDTGVGIAPENLNRIFEPFFTTKAIGKGTGLGLSVSYSIVQKHHGRLEVESKLGKGSTFTLWLPAKVPEGKGEGENEGGNAPAVVARPQND
jgi:PAS domain S-box-containing protein